MDPNTIAALVGAGAAVAGLFYVGFQVHTENKTRQLDIFQNTLSKIQENVQLYHDKYAKGLKKNSPWAYRFFNDLEWFAFLINDKRLTDQTLIEHLKDAVIYWYDGIFKESFDDTIINDEKQFSELKTLYRMFKNQ